MKRMGKGIALLILALIVSSCVSHKQKPNIILIMADDMGYECLSCNGSTSYDTPNLDKLANNGVRFTNCFSTPLCTPSRVQLMTGKYNHRNYEEFGTLPKGEKTFAHLSKDAGYATAVAGKWQLVGHYEGSGYKGEGVYPQEAGFDEHCLWQIDKFGSRYWSPLIQQNGSIIENTEDKFGPDLICDFIIDFIERKKEQPFLVYYPMILTHDPFVPTPDSEHSYEQKHKNDKAFFGDMVEYTDKIVGRIVKTINQLGLSDNTLVIFIGDNGTHKSITTETMQGPVTGAKGKTIDTGIHVPLIAKWAGQSASGKVNDDLIDFTDFLPTLLQAIAGKMPADFISDGRSFLPQIKGEKGNPRDWIFCHYDPKWGRWQKSSFVRTKQYKLYDDGIMYDVKSDPLEEKPILSGDELDNPIERRKMQLVFNKMK